MSDDPNTLAEHWKRFCQWHVRDNTPQTQRNELERAFMSGAIASVHLLAKYALTHSDYDYNAKLSALVAEAVAWGETFASRSDDAP